MDNIKKAKAPVRTLIILAAVLLILLATAFLHHHIRLGQEAPLRVPMGQLVEVNGKRMNIYSEGQGQRVLVFLSGGGTCSPVLDFRSLYSLLSDRYQIAVVEKAGYGFSDDTDVGRDITSILADTRQALLAAGIQPPYVLVPHSMSGLEALYWAQQYPEEVQAIIGLDMAVPEMYQQYALHMPMLRLSQFAARIGLTRWMPGISESDAIRFGTLTDHEKDVYRAVFYHRTASNAMLREAACVKENALVVESGGVPQVPMLLFASDGTGTGWATDVWLGCQATFAAQVKDCRLVELDCPHYVHDHEYGRISEEIAAFCPPDSSFLER